MEGLTVGEVNGRLEIKSGTVQKLVEMLWNHDQLYGWLELLPFEMRSHSRQLTHACLK